MEKMNKNLFKKINSLCYDYAALYDVKNEKGSALKNEILNQLKPYWDEYYEMIKTDIRILYLALTEGEKIRIENRRNQLLNK